jgi:hypothetical protein
VSEANVGGLACSRNLWNKEARETKQVHSKEYFIL